jgi:hypothetical protein
MMPIIRTFDVLGLTSLGVAACALAVAMQPAAGPLAASSFAAFGWALWSGVALICVARIIQLAVALHPVVGKRVEQLRKALPSRPYAIVSAPAHVESTPDASDFDRAA